MRLLDLSNIIGVLKEDHRYMIKLLYQLEQQIKSISGLTCQFVNLDRLLDIIDYIKQYPEICHHPIEEKMFTMAKQKPLSLTDHLFIEKVIDEHLLLDALVELLEIKVGECLAGRCSQASLLRTGKMFHLQQLKHIECEQNYVFPLCVQHFEEHDWQQLQFVADNILSQNDNLNSYQEMRKKIVQAHLVTTK